MANRVSPLHGGAHGGTRDAIPTAQQQSVLADRIRRCEPAAEEELVRLFSDRIAFLVRIRTGNLEAVPDLTQDIMLAVVLALRGEQLRDGERLAAFVYGIARNLINNHLRTRTRLPAEDALDEEVHFSSGSDPFEKNQRIALVRQALTTLDPIDRKILLMTLVDGLKPGEIAVRLGMTSEVVRARKSRAIKKTIDRVKRLSRT